MNDLNPYNIYALSDRSAVIDLGNFIDPEVNRKVLLMESWLRVHPFPGLLDLVPAYSSLTVLYDPAALYAHRLEGQTVFDLVSQKLHTAWSQAPDADLDRPRTVSIPACYDPVFGFDLEEIAAAKDLEVEELVQLHCATGYRVYMVGFLPGFAYMGTVNERLVVPRRIQPREVPAGAIGIAGWQTGIYPLASPGGWQIVGRTPLKLFEVNKKPPALLRAGDIVKFHPISLEEFESIARSPNDLMTY